MNLESFYLKLDTVRDTINPTIRGTQGDSNSIPIVADVLQDGKPIDLDGLVARVICKRPSDQFTTELAEIINDEVVFTLSGDDLSEVGICESVLALYDADGDRVSTMKFSYEVVGDLVSDAIPSGEIQESLLDKLDELHLAVLKIKPIADGTEGQILTIDEHGNTSWLDKVDGVDGLDGIDGINGLSAYEQALEGGYIGSKEEWIVSLKGERGTDGTHGIDGRTAYEQALDNGFEGSEIEWIASLKGEKGDTGYTPQKGIDYFDGVDGTDGKDGLSIKGDVGEKGEPFKYTDFTEEQVADLNGDKGDIGDSAYEIALAEGFVGTKSEWVESLNGIDGIDGKEYNDTEIQGRVLSLEEDIPTKRGNDTKIVVGDLETSLKALVNRESYDDKEIQAKVTTIESEVANLKVIGKDGKDGIDGSSAYQLALHNGYDGTEKEWLSSLKGDKGERGLDGANGIDGVTPQKNVDYFDGKDGEKGEPLTFDDLTVPQINELKGNDGAKGSDGQSAYELAVEEEYVGDKSEWIASLKGEKGAKGVDGTNATTTSIATTIADGLMSATDKVEVDKIPIMESNITSLEDDIASMFAMETQLVALGVDTLTLANAVSDGDVLQIIDTKYGIKWFEGVHWNRIGQVVTFTSVMIDDMEFEIINLGQL